MAKRQIIYFYEYSGEIRGNCVGHAKLMADMENIHISLAFSLPMWEKAECPVYFALESRMGELEILKLGSLMPQSVLTVYNYQLKKETIKTVRPNEAENVAICVLEENSKSNTRRYIKATSGVLNITLKMLAENVKNDDIESDENNLELKVNNEDTCENKVKLKVNNEDFCENKVKLKVNNEDFCENKLNLKVNNQDLCENKLKLKVNNESSYENEPEAMGKYKFPYERMLELRAEYNPFTTGKIKKAVKISLSDILLLSDNDPGLKENSFLLHSFYKYKHILLAAGSIFGQKCYYILSPGLKTGKEQRLADMYGFHNFISLDGQPAGPGAFGYYSWIL
jgi:hypothetical protein